MFESPQYLQDLCLDSICDNYKDIFQKYIVLTDQDVAQFKELPIPSDFKYAQTSSHQGSIPPSFSKFGELMLWAWPMPKETMGATTHFYKYKYKFRSKDQFLFEQLSQLLFDKFVSKKILTDETVFIFSPEQTRLSNIRIMSDNGISKEGLSYLLNHKIVNLECNSLIFVTELINSVNQWTKDHLRQLNISSCYFNNFNFSSVIAITRFKNLQKLDISNTEFNAGALDIICEDLKHLQSINLSNTRVSDISPLLKLKDNLTSLSLFNVGLYDSNMIQVILQLDHLIYLDISSEHRGMSPFEAIARGYDLDNFLKHYKSFPNLMYLDISGKEEVEIEYLKSFVMNHQRLTFLGLMHNECCLDDMFKNPNAEGYRKNLAIAGWGNEEQILVALRMYTDRWTYVQKSLYYLFRLSPSFEEARIDIIKLVLPGMARHPEQFGVQMAATACLYNLTKGDLASKIHPRVLKQVVDLTLEAMDNFPHQLQIQKNSLLTLCTDCILYDVVFDKFRCAKLVMKALISTDDVSMNRMAVAMISVLAATIKTEETTVIGSVPAHMKKLLYLLKQRVNERNCDMTMKFTLSALWNLTDESPTTCTVFLQEGGLDLFLEVLNTFNGENSIQTKVLGLINNVAEVPELRSQLMIPSLIKKLQGLLESDHITISYFAAGIVAYLASDGDDEWTIEEIPRSQILQSLGDVVLGWKPPETEMVAYRTFRPFFPLLKSQDSQIQLWAVCGIHHVCTENPTRYCQMLVDEGVNILLENIVENSCRIEAIREMASKILKIQNKGNNYL